MREPWSHQDRKSVGYTLSLERRTRRIRQRALAEALGISVSLLQKMEYGVRQPRAELLVEWTRALRYPIDQLFNDVGPTPHVESPPPIGNRRMTRADYRAIKNGSFGSVDRRRETIKRRDAVRQRTKEVEQPTTQQNITELKTEEQKAQAPMQHSEDLFPRHRATTGNYTLPPSPPDPRDRRQVFDPLSEKIARWSR